MQRFSLHSMKVCSPRMFLCLQRSVSAAIMVGVATCMLLGSLATAQDPPRYLVTTMENDQGESFRPTDINNSGLTVLGKYSSPHLYVPGNEPGTGTMIDLANLAGAMWIDLDTGDMWDQGDVGAPSWFADEARGINESNQIVGNALNGIESERVFVLENPLGPNPIFKLLPRLDDLNVWGLAINDNGVVVGTGGAQIVVLDPRTDPPYTPVGIPVPDLSESLGPEEINIHGDIVVGATVGGLGGAVISPIGINPDGSFIYGQNGVDGVHIFEGHDFGGINDSRQISGSRPSTGRGRNRVPGGTVRFQYDPDGENLEDRLVADPFIAESGNDLFSDVNEGGDVAFTIGRAYVYLEGLENPGPYALDQLVVFASPDDEAKWLASNGAQPNGINDQGQIIVRGDGSLGFFLTPISVTPDPGITATPDSNRVTTEAGGSAAFTVQLNTAPGGSVTVGVMSLDESEGLAAVSSLTFDDTNWDLPQDVTVSGVDDSEADGDQEYFIELAVSDAPVGSDYENVAPVLVGVTNQDDEVSAATLSVDGDTIVEGDKRNDTPGQFTVTLSGTPSGTVEVSYQVSDGRAKRNRDYRMIDPTSGDLVFAPGITSQTVAFEIIGDNASELNEDFTITLSNASGATITQSLGTVTIMDDD